jgi:hypothetical protein
MEARVSALEQVVAKIVALLVSSARSWPLLLVLDRMPIRFRLLSQEI